MLKFRTTSSELMRELQQSKIWLETGGAKGANACLAFEQHRGVDIAGAVLVEALLQETDFEGSRLDGATLISAEASGLCMANGSLRMANFTKARLIEADFNNADCRGAIVRRANLTRTNFAHSLLRDADFNNATCIATDLRWAELEGANFRSANLLDADLSGANLRGADLNLANVSHNTKLCRTKHLKDLAADSIFLDGQLIEGEEVSNLIFALSQRRD